MTSDEIKSEFFEVPPHAFPFYISCFDQNGERIFEEFVEESGALYIPKAEEGKIPTEIIICDEHRENGMAVNIQEQVVTPIGEGLDWF